MPGKERLLKAAMEQVAASPHTVTRAQIARHAGVHPKLISYYFGSRRQLLQAVTERLCEELVQTAALSASGTVGEPGERLREEVKILVRLLFKTPQLHFLLREEVLRIESAASQAFHQQLACRGRSVYEKILLDGVEVGQLRLVDAGFLFLAIIGMAQFFIVGANVLGLNASQRHPDEPLMEEYANFICDLILRGCQALAPDDDRTPN